MITQQHSALRFHVDANTQYGQVPIGVRVSRISMYFICLYIYIHVYTNVYNKCAIAGWGAQKLVHASS